MLPKCILCSRMLRKPVQTINGHLFCESCFLHRRTTHTHRCSFCVKDSIPEEMDCYRLGMEHVFGDRATVYDMNKLPAFCRKCGCQAPYSEILKYHIRMPCMGGKCFPCEKLQRILEKLSEAFN